MTLVIYLLMLLFGCSGYYASHRMGSLVGMILSGLLILWSSLSLIVGCGEEMPFTFDIGVVYLYYYGSSV